MKIRTIALVIAIAALGVNGFAQGGKMKPKTMKPAVSKTTKVKKPMKKTGAAPKMAKKPAKK